MASVPLVDTYRRYKVGTDKVIKWLLESGERCSPTLSKPTVASAASKTKVDDLLPMATRIAASTEPKIDITLELLDVLKDVITGRQLCANWYAALAKQSQQGESENDKTHRYFLDVLQKIYEVLQKEHKSRRPKRKKRMPQLPTDTGDLANLFQHLGLEETTEESSEASSTCSDKKPNTGLPVADTKLEDPEYEQEEMRFAVWALLHDLHEIRKFTRKIMKRFSDGKISFMAVAQATTDAMNVGASIAGQLQQEYTKLKGFDDAIRLVGVEHYFRHARTAQYSMDLGPDWEEAEKEFELLCVDGWTVIAMAKVEAAFRAVIERPEKSAHLLHSLYPQPGTPLHPLSDVFASVIPAFDGLQRRNQYDSSPDTLGKIWAFADFYTFKFFTFFRQMSVKEIDIGLVFATSLYCDLHDAMKGNMELGFSICDSLIVRQSSETADQIRALSQEKEQISSQVPSGLTEWLRTGKDLVAPHTSEDGVEGWLFRRSEDNQPFIGKVLLEMFPLLAAEITRQFCEIWEEIDTMLYNWKQSLLATAHLHKALAAGHETKPWSDLDFLMRAQDASSAPFLRQNGASVAVIFKEYAMALGFRVNQVSGTNKPKLKQALNAKYPQALQLQPAIRSAKDRRETVKMNLRLGLKPLPGDLRDVYNAIRRYHKTTGIQDDEIANQWQQTKKLSASQLLQVLHEIALHEEQFAYFNHLGFYMLCLKLMDFACAAYFKDLAARGKKHKLDRGMWCFEIVFEVLSEAATIQKRGLNKDKSILATTAEYFDEEIVRDASRFVDASRAEVQRQIGLYQATCRASHRSEMGVEETPSLTEDWNALLAMLHAALTGVKPDNFDGKAPDCGNRSLSNGENAQ